MGTFYPRQRVTEDTRSLRLRVISCLPPGGHFLRTSPRGVLPPAPTVTHQGTFPRAPPPPACPPVPTLPSPTPSAGPWLCRQAVSDHRGRVPRSFPALPRCSFTPPSRGLMPPSMSYCSQHVRSVRPGSQKVSCLSLDPQKPAHCLTDKLWLHPYR